MDETKALRFLAVILEIQEDIHKRLFNLEMAHSALRDGIHAHLPPVVKEDCRQRYQDAASRYQDDFDNRPDVYVVRQAIAEIHDLLNRK
jgi:hypothetical protein